MKIHERLVETPYFKDILNAISDGILIADGNGRVVWLNDACENLANTSRSEIIGKTAGELERERVFMPSVTKMVLDSLETVSTVQMTDKERKYITTGHPIIDSHGEIEGIVAHARDITEVVRTNSELADTQALLKRYTQEIMKIKNQRQMEASHDFFIGKSRAYQKLVDAVDKVAVTDTTVLLTGETGVGKNVVASKIHQYSERNEAPFVEVNCGAIPETLIESELFGYTKGAFTGASAGGKAGLIQMADRGTLFLDEVGELPLSLQTKFLQFLQQKRYLPVGSTSYQSADVRVIAATNKNLEEEVEKGKFRSDLFYRLYVLPIVVPSLRERKTDIFHLLQFFLQKYNEKHQRNVTLHPEVVDILEEYHWPGNIRELENLVERFVVMVSGNEVTIADLPPYVRSQHEFSFDYVSQLKDKTLSETLESIERNIIEDAYKQYKTTRKTAEKLGMTQSALMRRLKKYRERS
ncbi:sigma-54 interaction domain-containing protein [Alteribacillus iranensis]|uniref:HTH-type transcriptional regulatory protein TyrR n=1 Tax=Alteribacillus iranensis TaxID=930128 RepID=A0A1I2C6W1_9BACI|nr:sigma 54-interacting transcriptional regulator [Alteribacillus iranensis]SFE63918.1 PAS domain S-box-containing protein [Alteribacillus iranensis]